MSMCACVYVSDALQEYRLCDLTRWRAQTYVCRCTQKCPCVCVCAGLVPCNRWAELSQIGSWTPGSWISMCSSDSYWFLCILILGLRMHIYLSFPHFTWNLFIQNSSSDTFMLGWGCEVYVCVWYCHTKLGGKRWSCQRGWFWWFLLAYAISICFCCMCGGFHLQNLSRCLVFLDQRAWVMFTM